jgi:hypothetical protein
MTNGDNALVLRSIIFFSVSLSLALIFFLSPPFFFFWCACGGIRSFGVVVWEIFSFGRAPYPRMTQKEVVMRLMQGFRMERPAVCPVVSETSAS